MRWKGEKCFIVALFEFDLVLVMMAMTMMAMTMMAQIAQLSTWVLKHN